MTRRDVNDLVSQAIRVTYSLAQFLNSGISSVSPEVTSKPMYNSLVLTMFWDFGLPFGLWVIWDAQDMELRLRE